MTEINYPMNDREVAEFYMKKVRDMRDENEQLREENEHLKRSLLYIANRRESNADWTRAHNALSVYGRPKEER